MQISLQNRLGGLTIRGHVLRPGFSLPTDSRAPGGTLAKTRDYKRLEDTVGEIIYLATGN